MPVRINFPSSLQYGDNLEIKGEAGSDRFSLELISDYLAFDPVACNQLTGSEDELPIVETQPLQIVFEIAGGWDVNSKSPETSTTSHGTSARRFGFRSGEQFVCKIVISQEYFEITLNHMPIASSEHLVPIASIHALELDGDSVITSIKYGHPVAIEHYKDQLSTDNTIPAIIECRLSDMLLFENSYKEIEDSDKLRKNPLSNSEGVLCSTVQKKTGNQLYTNILPSDLMRTHSYQIVFQSDASETEEAPLPYTSEKTKVENVFHSVSQQDLLLLDDPEFSLDEDNQTILNSLRPKKNLQRRRKGSTRTCSSLARRAYAKREMNCLAKHISEDTSLRSSVLGKTPADKPNALAMVNLKDDSVAVQAAPFDSVQSLEKFTSTSPVPATTEHTFALSKGELPTFVNHSIQRRHRLSIPDMKNFDYYSTFDANVDHRENNQQRALRHSQSIGTNKHDHQGVWHPLTSMDRLWADVLPIPLIKPDIFPSRNTRVSALPSTNIMTDSHDLPSPTQTYPLHTVKKELTEGKSEIFNEDRLLRKNVAHDAYPDCNSSTGNKYIRTPVGTNSVLPVNPAVSNHKLPFCSTDDKFSFTKTSQPMLLIDFCPIDEQQCVVKDNPMMNTIQKNPWKERPKSYLALASHSEASSQESVKSNNTNTVEVSENKSGREFNEKPLNTHVPHKVAPTKLPIANTNKTTLRKSIISGDHTAHNIPQQPEVNGTTRRSIFRSKLPRPKSEFLSNDFTSLINQQNPPTSPSNIAGKNQKPDTNQEVLSENFIPPRVMNNHEYVNNIQTRKKLPLNGHNSFGDRDNRAYANQKIKKPVAKLPTWNASVENKTKDTKINQITNGFTAQNEGKVEQHSQSKESLVTEPSNLKKFVQSPRRWISEKFSTHKKQKAAAK